MNFVKKLKNSVQHNLSTSLNQETENDEEEISRRQFGKVLGAGGVGAGILAMSGNTAAATTLDPNFLSLDDDGEVRFGDNDNYALRYNDEFAQEKLELVDSSDNLILTVNDTNIIHTQGNDVYLGDQGKIDLTDKSARTAIDHLLNDPTAGIAGGSFGGLTEVSTSFDITGSKVLKIYGVQTDTTVVSRREVRALENINATNNEVLHVGSLKGVKEVGLSPEDVEFMSPHTGYGDGLIEEEIYRFKLNQGENFGLTHLEASQQGGGTDSNFTVKLYDEESDSLLTTVELGEVNNSLESAVSNVTDDFANSTEELEFTSDVDGIINEIGFTLDQSADIEITITDLDTPPLQGTDIMQKTVSFGSGGYKSVELSIQDYSQIIKSGRDMLISITDDQGDATIRASNQDYTNITNRDTDYYTITDGAWPTGSNNIITYKKAGGHVLTTDAETITLLVTNNVGSTVPASITMRGRIGVPPTS